MSLTIQEIRKKMTKSEFKDIQIDEWRSSVVLSGKSQKWETVVKAGFIAAKGYHKGVVNLIELQDFYPDKMAIPTLKDKKLNNKTYDVVVIGGGIIGTSILRELSRYQLNTILLEKEDDLAIHASSRNDGMIHPGFAASPGSKKAYYNTRGNRAYETLSKELGIKFKRVGTLILFSHPFTKTVTPILKDRAKQNEVDGYNYLNREEVFQLEPYITPDQHGAFYLPSTAIISPYRATIAFAENAIQNGAQVSMKTLVTGFDRKNGEIVKIKTNRGNLKAKIVINAAGIWADKIAEYADDRFYTIHGRKGVDCILDIRTGQYQSSVIAKPSFFQFRSKTKGGGLVPTVEGNLIAGPTAEETPFRENYSTNPSDLDKLLKHLVLNTKVSSGDVINYFAGIRSCTYKEDFIVEKSEYIKNFIHVAGIQSPGVASAPAIAEDVSQLCVKMLEETQKVTLNPHFEPVRVKRPEMVDLSMEERAEIIRKNPSYGQIICRCETVSEGEVRDALRSPISVTSTDGVKRRTRAGMGRCHGGFCTPRILEIISDELKIPLSEITKKGGKSNYLFKKTKGKIDYSRAKIRPIKSKDNQNE